MGNNVENYGVGQQWSKVFVIYIILYKRILLFQLDFYVIQKYSY